jgi:hypothetical protein
MQFTWNPEFNNEFSPGYEDDDDLSISMGGLNIRGAKLQMDHPPQEIYGWRFGYVQTVLKAKITWYYNQRQSKTEKTIHQPALDGSGDHGFWYTAPRKVETVLTKPMTIHFPAFKDYPRTYGTSTNFSAVQGLARFSLWAVIRKGAQPLTLLQRLNWCIRYDTVRGVEGVVKGVEGRVGLDSFGNSLTAPVLTGGRAEDVQTVTSYNLSQAGNWEEEQEGSSSSSSSSSGDEELEIVDIDWGQIKPPSWF